MLNTTIVLRLGGKLYLFFIFIDYIFEVRHLSSLNHNHHLKIITIFKIVARYTYYANNMYISIHSKSKII